MPNTKKKGVSTSMMSRLKEKFDFPGLLKFPSQRSVSLIQYEHEILAEHLFRRVFCWERKRAERSGKSFLLMLVNVERLLRTNGNDETLSELVSALNCSTRETDIAGWYREGAILGVIFIETHKADRDQLESLITARVTEEMRARLGTEHADQIHLSFHMFPEDCRQGTVGRMFDANLYPDLLERDETRRFSYFVKRALDIVGSSVALVLCSPLLVAISLAVKLTSKGPILFKQERVGWYGRRFLCLKFRSMTCINDPGIHRGYVRRLIAGGGDSPRMSENRRDCYKIQADPRVTRVGKFLRRTSLDELPQFINVLKGEMSLVGPRPPIPYELEIYKAWHWRRVLEARPGITGLWQVKGRSRIKFDDMVRLDLHYAKTWSLWADIKILLQTPRAVLSGEGAY